MEYRLGKIANIYSGLNYKRYETKLIHEASTPYELFSQSHFQKIIGEQTSERTHEPVRILKKYDDHCKLTTKQMLLIDQSRFEAVAITDNMEQLLISSNYLIVELSTQVIPSYLEWYFNYHAHVRRQLEKHKQGSALQRLSIQALKQLNVELPALETQVKLGTIYELHKQKRLAVMERMVLEEQVIYERMKVKLEE